MNQNPKKAIQRIELTATNKNMNTDEAEFNRIKLKSSEREFYPIELVSSPFTRYLYSTETRNVKGILIEAVKGIFKSRP